MRIFAAFLVVAIFPDKPATIPIVLCFLLWKLIDVCEKVGKSK
jgi:hypothetical protein